MSSGNELKVTFVTGKGGVGKSTVAAAMALESSMSGRRTLLVELGHQSFFQDFLNLSGVGYKPIKLRDNLDLALWSGSECLREYALHLLKIQSLYRLFFENPVSRALVNVAPALHELSILGKITSGPPRHVGPDLPYQHLVVDAYATGHFLALLRAPKGMSEAVRFGPMGEQSRGIDRIIRDPHLCKYFVVSLPEEMPVSEAAELSAGLKTEFGIQSTYILNKVFPDSDGSGSPEFEASTRELYERRQEALRSLKDQRLIELPYVFENNPWKLIETLGRGLHGAT